MKGKISIPVPIFSAAVVAGVLATGIELAAARTLAPFYGTGLAVWAASLAAVLLGFAGGYFVGGNWFRRYRSVTSMANFCLCAVSYLLLMAMVIEPLMAATYQWFGSNGVVPMSLLLATPPIMMLSAIAPGLTNTVISKAAAPDETGRLVTGAIAGRLYGASTIGGMLGIFGFGFWLLPMLGVALAWLSVILGGCMLAALLAMYHGPKSLPRLGMAAAVALTAIGWVIVRPNTLPNHIQEKSVGMMGEVIVTDLPLEPEYGGGPRRMLLNNRIAQTAVDPASGISLWDYTHYLSSLAGSMPSGSRALVLGLAGGSVANELVAQGLHVHAVEIDPRLPAIARTYFALDPAVTIILDDARHYLNTSKEQYDLIVYDLFAGEGQPSHVFSMEAFTRAEALLRPGGILLINGHGFWEGPEGLGSRSVAATLGKLGFYLYLVPTPGTPVQRNLLLMASKAPITLNGKPWRQNTCCQARIQDVRQAVHPLLEDQYRDGICLSDDRPVLDLLNQSAYQAWRDYAIAHYLLPLRNGGLHYF